MIDLGRDRVTGKFTKTRFIFWTEETWDDGFINIRGKFMVYRPDFPKASKAGWAHRARVVWWLRTGEVPIGDDIHHINEIKLDDKFENLQRIPHGEHTSLHSTKQRISCICKYCQKEFFMLQWQINQGKGIFCSQLCYHWSPKSKETRRRQAASHTKTKAVI